MLNERKNWNPRLPEFLVEAETLLARSEECLVHLQLIRNDADAVRCLLDTLQVLANRADILALGTVSRFANGIHAVLSQAHRQVDLHAQALDSLQACLTLMAWQLELVDQSTGQLSLDESEQISLIEAFARRANGSGDESDLTMADFETTISRFVPMSKMRKDEFTKLRDWANQNAISASAVVAGQNDTETQIGGRQIDF